MNLEENGGRQWVWWVGLESGLLDILEIPLFPGVWILNLLGLDMNMKRKVYIAVHGWISMINTRVDTEQQEIC